MLSLINSLLPVLCLCIGFFIGYKFNNNNKLIEVPDMVKHPHRYIKEKRRNKKETKAIQEEIDYLNDVLYNIENYNGTSLGQKSIKRGVGN